MKDQIEAADAARPHDLLWISSIEVIFAPCALPDWVRKAIAATPIVVVRRAARSGNAIPVGIRGQARSERFAAFIAPHAVRKRITPENLVQTRRWREIPRPESAAMRRALESVAARWNGFRWGPAGSVGFELATGLPVTTDKSDLDLVIHAPQRITANEAEVLLKSVAGLEVRADVRIETPFGSVALQEHASPTSPRILMKTCAGPMLVADPWMHPIEEAPLPAAS
ncbi:MAG TPA: malonate decarboxylase holo-ACP synthase [Terracidiphilus sp.]|nr:malonate decarboxylase holo-ACP synthase [Terracidiphilus sp.]